MATQTVLDLTEELATNHGFLFSFLFRTLSDGVENIFSVARMKNSIPHTVQAKNALKAIRISQYMKVIPKSNYQQDDREILSDFLNILKDYGKNDESAPLLDDLLEGIDVDRRIFLRRDEINVLSNIGGLLVDKYLQKPWVLRRLFRRLSN
ncbi:hypothetical protein QAD02_023644 [Eretmocerus hayati]|uniref:Uncharacterized protein n=1 Tax=Eretmocerus hayati TaxID=131215 RepID=A0ACC2PW67_9HYME|nr:hypothetical protein QAD02_023644 [Eretmocerus hayati]